MNNDTPGRRLIAAIKTRITRVRIAWLEWELRTVEHDILDTTEEIADCEIDGLHRMADALLAHLHMRVTEAGGLRDRIHQLKESLQ